MNSGPGPTRVRSIWEKASTRRHIVVPRVRRSVSAAPACRHRPSMPRRRCEEGDEGHWRLRVRRDAAHLHPAGRGSLVPLLAAWATTGESVDDLWGAAARWRRLRRAAALGVRLPLPCRGAAVRSRGVPTPTGPADLQEKGTDCMTIPGSLGDGSRRAPAGTVLYKANHNASGGDTASIGPSPAIVTCGPSSRKLATVTDAGLGRPRRTAGSCQPADRGGPGCLPPTTRSPPVPERPLLRAVPDDWVIDESLASRAGAGKRFRERRQNGQTGTRIREKHLLEPLHLGSGGPERASRQ